MTEPIPSWLAFLRDAVIRRFWTRVNKDGPIPLARPELGQCWLWTRRQNHGYGSFDLNNKKVPAHRFAYELLVGPIPPDLEPDHLCRVRNCVRPDHIELVTHRVNSLRSTSPTAENARLTHCRRGHPFDEKNTGKQKGVRRCLACKRLNDRRKQNGYAVRS